MDIKQNNITKMNNSLCILIRNHYFFSGKHFSFNSNRKKGNCKR